ncbi:MULTISPECIES: TetR/AcrR family transcriptional regulator [Rhizobium/Agrobacterium group]|jgi:AcrR family transcriptional regulator|uniref:TetR/AcrR family transcriptional regulator n=1 Tax=Rhizobium/Agrobacterium group TaxID=227290 RepID=UPI000712873F|nr:MULTISPECIES: TetR/AcrR family transcriptional regulator [Rhizobium/Agrobacterium group]KQQ72767.1 TetR family transcriptional regulator [Rhizobium sp. Leaf321]MBD8650659.1 TetR/AcrR family transcriptional regulator [Rhizobium sp. CFBP 13726]NSY17876.1 TetR/AcrR family transcriptional regulator [Neorhizobium sp. AL 9.2.2]
MPDFSPRQNEVLEQALRLLVEGGEKALTTSGLARAASCSKESLYKWFGDREGLLAAMIAHQAAKVRTFERSGERLSAELLRDHLELFARDLLEVLSGDVSLALNRLAIGQSGPGAGPNGSKLGKLLVEHGRRQIDRRAMALIDAGKRVGLLRFDNADAAYHTLYGLIVSDLHVRMLLGEPGLKDTARQAERAIDAFLSLYRTEKQPLEVSRTSAAR